MAFFNDPENLRAILVGAGKYPKDDSLESSDQIYGDLENLSDMFKDPKVFGYRPEHVASLIDVPDNIEIKEAVAMAAESSSSLLFFYSGHLIVRKGQVYLATVNTTKSQAYINGISLSELIDIIQEAGGKKCFIVLDAPVHWSISQPSEKGKVYTELLAGLEEKYADIHILASPAQSINDAALLPAILDTLKKGSPLEKDVLSLGDICGILQREGDIDIIASEMTLGSGLPFVRNQRFVRFQEFKEKADALFGEEQFAEALPLYEQAIDLFSDHRQVNDKVSFIHHLQKGDMLFADDEFKEARQAYEDAANLWDTPFIQKKVDATLEQIAAHYYDLERYEYAKPYYELLHKRHPGNTMYSQRHEVCIGELEFTQLVDRGDKHYFKDEFDLALPFYEGALKINRDHIVTRRKEECEKFVTRERLLREKLTQELGGLENNSPAISDDEIDQIVGEKVTDRVKLEIGSFDDAFWARISLWDAPEAYRAYIDIFKNRGGAHVGKAIKRIAELISEMEPPSSGQEMPEGQPEYGTDAPQPTEDTTLTEDQVVIQDEVVKQPEEDLQKSDNEFYSVSEGLLDNLLDDAKNVKAEESSTSDDLDLPEYGGYDISREFGEEIEEDVANLDLEGLFPSDKPSLGPAENASNGFSNGHSLENGLESQGAVDLESEGQDDLPPTMDEPIDRDLGVDIASNGNDIGHVSIEEEMQGIDSEDELWKKTVEVNSLEAYRYYLDNTDSTENLADAYYMINQLNHPGEQEQEEASQDNMDEEVDNTVASVGEKAEAKEEISGEIEVSEHLEEVGQQESPSKSKEQVEPAISNVVEQEEESKNGKEQQVEEVLWNQATTEDSLSAYFSYLNTTTLKTYWDEAKSRINELKSDSQEKEQQDWVQAQIEDTIEAYKGYIKKYPLGNYYAKAMFRLNKLEGEFNNS